MPKEINELLGVPKGGGEKHRFIMDSRRENYHFIETEYPEIPHPGLFMQVEKARKKETYVRKLDIDNF